MLDLSGTRLPSAGQPELGQLTGLEELDLGYTAMDDTGLAHLTPLKGLRKLGLRGTKVTPAGAERLRKDLPNTEVLVGE